MEEPWCRLTIYIYIYMTHLCLLIPPARAALIFAGAVLNLTQESSARLAGFGTRLRKDCINCQAMRPLHVFYTAERIASIARQ